MTSTTKKPEPRWRATQADRNDPLKKIDSLEPCSPKAQAVKRQRRQWSERSDIRHESSEAAVGVAFAVGILALFVALLTTWVRP